MQITLLHKRQIVSSKVKSKDISSVRKDIACELGLPSENIELFEYVPGETDEIPITKINDLQNGQSVIVIDNFGSMEDSEDLNRDSRPIRKPQSDDLFEPFECDKRSDLRSKQSEHGEREASNGSRDFLPTSRKKQISGEMDGGFLEGNKVDINESQNQKKVVNNEEFLNESDSFEFISNTDLQENNEPKEKKFLLSEIASNIRKRRTGEFLQNQERIEDNEEEDLRNRIFELGNLDVKPIKMAEEYENQKRKTGEISLFPFRKEVGICQKSNQKQVNNHFQKRENESKNKTKNSKICQRYDNNRSKKCIFNKATIHLTSNPKLKDKRVKKDSSESEQKLIPATTNKAKSPETKRYRPALCQQRRNSPNLNNCNDSFIKYERSNQSDLDSWGEIMGFDRSVMEDDQVRQMIAQNEREISSLQQKHDEMESQMKQRITELESIDEQSISETQLKRHIEDTTRLIEGQFEGQNRGNRKSIFKKIFQNIKK